MKWICVILVIILAGCVTTGTFSGKVRNSDGEIVYTFDGDTKSKIGPDPIFTESFSIFGLSIAEILAVLGGIGVIGTGGVVAKKKIAKKKTEAKKKGKK